MHERRYAIEQQARAFIAAVDWVEARTMAHYNPHEYVHTRRVEDRAGFAVLAALIDAGDVRRYQGTPYRYVELDGFTYWSTWGGGRLINRKPTASAGWDEEDR